MKRLSYRSGVGLLAVLLAVVAFQASASASHAWRKYHWARTTNTFTLNLEKNLTTAAWSTSLTNASADWNQSVVLHTTVVPGGTNPSQCNPTSGRVEVCNAAYGSTGWLGVAQIWIVRGSHITQGTVKVNDTYFNTSQYNSPAWRQLVMCQEVGHTFGLDHQDETNGNTNLGSCMDYTNDPDGSLYGQLNNTRPNLHDYDELAKIYSHLDSFTTVSAATSPSPAPALDNPSEWGQLMKVSHGGKTQIFERQLGNGQIVVTFVIWA
jgi:hypothetical protein